MAEEGPEELGDNSEAVAIHLDLLSLHHQDDLLEHPLLLLLPLLHILGVLAHLTDEQEQANVFCSSYSRHRQAHPAKTTSTNGRT